MRRAKVELAAMVSTGYVGQAARMGQGTLHAAGNHIGWRSLPIWAYPSSSRDSPPRSSHASNTLRTQPSLVRLPASSPTSVNATTLKQLQSLPLRLHAAVPNFRDHRPASAQNTAAMPYNNNPIPRPANITGSVSLPREYCLKTVSFKTPW